MRLINSLLIVTLVLGFFVFVAAPASAQQESQKLNEIRDRGILNCGVNGSVPGFSIQNPDTGDWEGLDVDFCRALAVAIFGPEDVDSHINFVPLTPSERFVALQSGDVDVLIRNTTWTLTRDTTLNANFGPTTYYDGQGLLVKGDLVDLGVSTMADLEGASFCTLTGTTTEKNIVDAYSQFFGEMPTLVLGEDSAATIRDFEQGACDVLTSDKSQLAGLRSASSDPSSMILLDDILSKEPLGPVYLDDDQAFGDIVDWTVYATFQAEEFGITRENLGEFDGTDNKEIARFLGQDDSGLGTMLSLSDSFAADIISVVGNYAEIYERNILPIGIPRESSNNANMLWKNGGLHYPPAWR